MAETLAGTSGNSAETRGESVGTLPTRPSGCYNSLSMPAGDLGDPVVDLERERRPLFPAWPARLAATRRATWTQGVRQVRRDARADRATFGPPAPEWVPVAGRPLVRADCEAGPRPCPWLGCRYHLGVDVTPAGGLHFTLPGGELEDLRETCALDVADRGAISLDELAAILGVTRARAVQVEQRALWRLRRRWALRLAGERPTTPAVSAADQHIRGDTQRARRLRHPRRELVGRLA